MAKLTKEQHDKILDKISKTLAQPAEVYNPETGEIVFVGSYWDCYQLLWEEDKPLMQACRTGLEIRELDTDAAKVLYGPKISKTR